MVGTPQQRLMGIKDSPDLALQDWLSFAEFDPDATWPRGWAWCGISREHNQIALSLLDVGCGVLLIIFVIVRCRCEER
jgi:predicted oxidoreductase